MNFKVRNGNYLLAKYDYQLMINCKNIKERCDYINFDYEYSKKFNNYKWFKFYMYVLFGVIKPHQLPSYHPIIKLSVRYNLEKSYLRLKANYEICKNDAEQIKILFNKTTTLKNIEEQINNKINKINNYKKPSKFIRLLYFIPKIRDCHKF